MGGSIQFLRRNIQIFCDELIMRSTILGLILLLAASLVEAAPPLSLDECRDFCLLGKYMEIIEDKEGNLTIEEVLSEQTAARFVLSQLDVPNFGQTHSVYWVRFILENRTSENRERRLVMHPFMIWVDLYTVTDTGTYEMVRQDPASPCRKGKLIISGPLLD